ncbi:hypothetical protein CTAYLR_001481 [Chrysophaeum taylorii]|uniref:MYND-type domain-containing protein n=1 Tax=Chrysophaeum taylorii TaxID=2483200 RepID=A0AAD7UAJ6_9STRA|nr:hypothetical protein CTAYLR_001481 [Chrysophaeum taylorii]
MWRFAALVAVAATAAAAAVWAVRWRRRRVAALSVPEALHVLTHSASAELRGLAARALCAILFGEVAVLEELLDEVRRTHPEFGAPRSDGRHLLDVAIDDMANGSQDAAMLLLAATETDPEWDDRDEWNKLTAEAAALVDADRLPITGGLAQAAAVLVARKRNARAPTPRGLSLHDACAPRIARIPDVLPFNTRVACAECGASLLATRCPACNNVGYCCESHATKDAARHALWCPPFQ